jgi:hypothetical protein
MDGGVLGVVHGELLSEVFGRGPLQERGPNDVTSRASVTNDHTGISTVLEPPHSKTMHNSYNGFKFGTSIWLGFGREKALMPLLSTKIKFFKKTVPYISFLLL